MCGCVHARVLASQNLVDFGHTYICSIHTECKHTHICVYMSVYCISICTCAMLRPCGLVVRRATCCNRRPFRCLLIAGVLADLYGGAYQDLCWHKGQNILLVVAGVKIDTSHNVQFWFRFRIHKRAFAIEQDFLQQPDILHRQAAPIVPRHCDNWHIC